MGSSGTIAPSNRRVDRTEAAKGRTAAKKADPRLEAELAELLGRYADPHDEQRIDRISPAEIEQLRKLWKTVISKWPAFPRRRFLRHQLGLIALGADGRERLEAQLTRLVNVKSMEAPSAAWGEAWGEMGEELPRQGPADGEHRVRMKRRKGVRGPDGRVTRPASRWTPPQCFDLESELDEITMKGLTMLPNIVSPSADAIQRIERRRGREARYAGREALVGTGTPE